MCKCRMKINMLQKPNKIALCENFKHGKINPIFQYHVRILITLIKPLALVTFCYLFNFSSGTSQHKCFHIGQLNKPSMAYMPWAHQFHQCLMHCCCKHKNMTISSKSQGQSQESLNQYQACLYSFECIFILNPNIVKKM